MACLPHYFTPFQAFVIQESENERLRFDLRVGLEILRREAEYRAERTHAAGHFSLSVRGAVPQSAGLRPRAGSDRRRSGVRRNVARLDSQGAAADRHGRYRRRDLRAQRVLLAAQQQKLGDRGRRGSLSREPNRPERAGSSVEPGRCRRPLWRARRPDRAGQSQEGPALSVLLAAPAVGLSGGAASEAGRPGTSTAAAASSPAGTAGNAAEDHRRGAAWRPGFDASSTSDRQGDPCVAESVTPGRLNSWPSERSLVGQLQSSAALPCRLSRLNNSAKIREFCGSMDTNPRGKFM